MDGFVSIITVNYNGKRFLEEFLHSTRALKYPRNKYEVIVVDNASKDDSVSFIRRNFPEVKIVRSSSNLGFGGGNNLGMRNAKGDLFFLVNNDTVLHKEVLKNIVNCYRRWSKKAKIGAINSKLVLFDKYLPFKIEKARFMDYGLPKKAQPKSKMPFLFVRGKGKIYWEEVYLPFSSFYDENLMIKLKIRNAGFRHFEVYLGKEPLRGNFNVKLEPKTLHLNLNPGNLKIYSVDFIQNAGNILFRDGDGRDRGAVIINKEQYYEVDQGQYDNEEKIQAFCGAGVLLNRKALKEVGYFDENFFMYYEDGDLSLRLKKAGWEIVYCPGAVIRHIHAGSSKEWSPFFIFQVERNRLLLVSKHWPRTVALKEWFHYFIKDTLGFLYLYYYHRKVSLLERFKLRLKVNLSLAGPFLINLFRASRLSDKELKGWW